MHLAEFAFLNCVTGDKLSWHLQEGAKQTANEAFDYLNLFQLELLQ